MLIVQNDDNMAHNFVITQPNTCRRYQYKYHVDYGSPEVNAASVPVQSARLSADRRTVSLTMPDLREGFVYELTMEKLTPDPTKTPLNKQVCYMLNKLLL
jgi:hypothetical protein